MGTTPAIGTTSWTPSFVQAPRDASRMGDSAVAAQGLSSYRMNVALIGRNLRMHANAPHIDPETAFSAGNQQGFEMGQLPSTRSLGSRSASPPDRSDAYQSLHIMMRKNSECVFRRSVACRGPHGLRQRQADGGERQPQSAGSRSSRRRCSRTRRSALSRHPRPASSTVSRDCGRSTTPEIQYAEADLNLPRNATTEAHWVGFYTGPSRLHQILTQSATSPNLVGPALVMRAFTVQTMTDFWGDIPLTEAGQGATNFTPKYDAQSVVYDAIFASLTRAASLMTPLGVRYGETDPVYGLADSPRRCRPRSGSSSPTRSTRAPRCASARSTPRRRGPS